MDYITKSGWRNVKSRRTIRWRGKRMTVTINRPCFFYYVVPPSRFYFSATADPTDWR